MLEPTSPDHDDAGRERQHGITFDGRHRALHLGHNLPLDLDHHAAYRDARLVKLYRALADLERDRLHRLHGDGADIDLHRDVTELHFGALIALLYRYLLVALDGDGAVVVDLEGLIVLDFGLHVLLRMQKDHFAALLVVEREFVEVVRAALGHGSRAEAQLRLLGGREDRLVVAVIEAADDDGTVGIGIHEGKGDLPADTREELSSPLVAGPWLRP